MSPLLACLTLNRGQLDVHTSVIYSEICEPFDKVIKLLSVNHSAAILVKLEVPLLKVLLVPGLVLAGGRHDLHNELS